MHPYYRKLNFKKGDFPSSEKYSKFNFYTNLSKFNFQKTKKVINLLKNFLIKMKNKKKIMVVAAHPDDDFRMRRNIDQIKKQGYNVQCIFLADGESSRNIKDKNKLLKISKIENIKLRKCQNSLNLNDQNFLDYLTIK